MNEQDLFRAYVPLEERLAHEVPLALGAALWRAHDALRPVEAALELEAADPRIGDLHARTHALRAEIAALLVDVALDAAQVAP